MFTSPAYSDALIGNYSITGVTGDIGNLSLDFGKVRAANGAINGYSFSVTGNAALKVPLPSGSAYYHAGHGWINQEPIFEFNYKNWFKGN